MAGTLDTLLQGAIVVAILALANIVAGGVIVLLGTQVLAMDEGPVKLAAYLAVVVLAIGCAILMIKACIREVSEALQCPRGNRGGRKSTRGAN